MTNLVETDEFTAGIYQLEIADAPEGGVLGIDNVPPRQLANRTLWLKNRLAEHSAAVDPHPQYMTASESDAVIAAAIAALVGSTPAALDTLNELAAALGNDPNFAASLNSAIAARLTQAQADELYATIGSAASVVGKFRNLKIDAIGLNNYNCVITADEVVLENGTNKYITLRAVNKTINANGVVGDPLSIMSARAASTLYFRWLWYSVANGLTATLDASSIAPTAPAGYIAGDYKMLLPGACRTDSSGNTYLMQTSTVGLRTKFVPLAGSNTTALLVAANGALGTFSQTAPTWASVSLGSFIPVSRAASVDVTASAEFNGLAASSYLVSSSNVYAGPRSACPPVIGSNNSVGQTADTISGTIMLESSNLYVASNNTGFALQIIGWEDKD